MLSVNFASRYLFFGSALFLCALGIALVTSARLGTTSATSVPYVLSQLSGLPLGIRSPYW
jgi:uncharacterized membrane protein YczE